MLSPSSTHESSFLRLIPWKRDAFRNADQIRFIHYDPHKEGKPHKITGGWQEGGKQTDRCFLERDLFLPPKTSQGGIPVFTLVFVRARVQPKFSCCVQPHFSFSLPPWEVVGMGGMSQGLVWTKLLGVNLSGGNQKNRIIPEKNNVIEYIRILAHDGSKVKQTSNSTNLRDMVSPSN